MTDVKKIESYSLYEFCKEVQEAVISGYRFDFNSNELFPTAFGSMLVAGMVKAPSQQQQAASQPKINSPQTLVVEDEAEEVTEAPKRGRKPKE